MFSFLTHNDLKITRHAVTLPGLSERFSSEAEPLRLVQVSDMHFYEYTDPSYYQRVADTVNKLNPHLIVSTGDLIHYGGLYVEDAGRFLSQLKASYGKYAVLGNHDYADGKRGQLIRAMLKDSGYQLLLNDHVCLQPQTTSPPSNNPSNSSEPNLWLVGLDDYKHGTPHLEKSLSGIPKNKALKDPVIMLAHNPLHFDVITQHADSPVDLVLSGHTHAGHFYLPFLKPIYRYVLKMKYRYGFYQKNNTRLYVTSGLGGAAFYINLLFYKRGFPRFRYNSCPEIAVFDLIPAIT